MPETNKIHTTGYMDVAPLPSSGLMDQAGVKPSGVVGRDTVGYVSFKPTPEEQAKIDASKGLSPVATPPPPVEAPQRTVTMDVTKWEGFQADLREAKARAAKAESDLRDFSEKHNEVLAAIAGPINLLRALGGDTPLDLGTIERILRGL